MDDGFYRPKYRDRRAGECRRVPWCAGQIVKDEVTMTAPPRIPKEAGYCEPSRLPRGARGFPLCRQCATECPTKRNTFCSQACVHEWKLRTQPAYQARHVLERDAGVCGFR
jgi:hypothetical protein